MRRIVPLVCLLLLALPLHAQDKPEKKEPPPQVVVALPFAVDVGKTTRLTLRGLRLDTVTEIRLHEPHSSGKVLGNAKKVGVPNQQKPERVGDTQVEVEITLPEEVPSTTVPFSVVGPGGESAPYRVLVNDESPRVAEKEPNDGFRAAQPVEVGQVLEGSFRAGQDPDVYRLELADARPLTVEVWAGRFGSPADGVLAVHDAGGSVLALVDDAGPDADPRLTFTPPGPGTYYLSLIDAFDQGGDAHAYRLGVRPVK